MRIFSTGWSEGYDGPGRRWVVYMKGCNLRCRWCANPESVEAAPQMLFYPSRGESPHQACPNSAVRKDGAGRWRLERPVCATCGAKDCVNLWRHPAMEVSGRDMTPAEILDQALKTRDLFAGGGGVTFGGGEPTLQMDELLESIRLVRGGGIHTAVETNATSHEFGRLVGQADLLICDLKCIDKRKHVKWTGMENVRILENLRQASTGQKDFWIRIPAVTGLNTDEVEVQLMADEIAGLVAIRPEGRLVVEILPMHHLGQPKYHALDMDYPMEGVAPPDSRHVERMSRAFAKAGAAIRMAGRVVNSHIEIKPEKNSRRN